MRYFCRHNSMLLIFFLLTINKSESLKRNLKRCQLKCNKTDGVGQASFVFGKNPIEEQVPSGRDRSDGKDGKDFDLKLVMDIVNRLFLYDKDQVIKFITFKNTFSHSFKYIN